MLLHTVFLVLILASSSLSAEKFFWDLNLPRNHLPFVFGHHKEVAKSCVQDSRCPYKDLVDDKTNQCWGYEDNCDRKQSYSKEEPKGCGSQQVKNDFWFRADFGFVTNIQQELKDIAICLPKDTDDSSLTCSRKHKPENDRFKSDIFEKGMIGGHCTLDSELLNKQGQHAYPLQSWYSELQNYTNLSFRPLHDDHGSNCDVIIEKPTVLMKLDSGINLYHHFCDFFNLYLSQHVNNSWFDTDIQIVMWDTSSLGYFDIATAAWNAFTDHPIIKLQDWKGKRVCLKDAMFPLLPRMRGGLYYNTYIPNGCVGSSMFRAFSEHFLHRMGVTQNDIATENSTKIRVTLLERGKPEDEHVFRKIKNQDELIEVMKEFPDFEIKVVQYKWKDISFVEQLKITHNSDIFIGMHGAGLIHFLFLPDWAVAFELYNCDDERCYRDLARLRGLDYITWEKPKPIPSDQGKHKRYGDHMKFWNWSFDPNEFRTLIRNARALLLVDPRVQKRMKQINEKNSQHVEL
ncbi:EGF domain-specific O-linked N-acetylglucosamine transferase-like isoform X2 [Styela clava]|uniref:EGF domain-specific O-linked N-acetylglucosamine transferase-like isoform X2 n=1 Tax=Styela clava TaxID=7725 RepID=UPI00193A03BF|nr:EGF domain-specific O-linked N-acetylglucosamine transferase-like isoform X2 [Styela clava]